MENAQPGYMPQDPSAEFDQKIDLLSWMSTWTGKADDEQIVRATLGRLLFSGDETKKSVKVLSGGEKGRMMYGKLMLTRPNVMLMDEPTNHMDMETIESLQIGLEKYPGTLVFVSHDREFVGGLADADDRTEAGRQLQRFHRQLRRIPRRAGPRIVRRLHTMRMRTDRSARRARDCAAFAIRPGAWSPSPPGRSPATIRSRPGVTRINRPDRRPPSRRSPRQERTATGRVQLSLMGTHRMEWA